MPDAGVWTSQQGPRGVIGPAGPPGSPAASDVVDAQRDLGLVADGVTDNTAKLADGLSASVGRVIHFRDGTYVWDTVTPPWDVQITCDPGVVFKQKAGATMPMFYKAQAPRTLQWRFILKGHPIFQGESHADNPGAEALRAGIYLVYGRRIVIEGPEFYDFKSTAIHLQDCRDATVENVVAERCSNAGGRNAIDVMGTDNLGLPDTTDVACEWLVRNCKVDNAGAAAGGAGGICVVAKNAQQVRATIESNWVYNCLTFAGVVFEAGFQRYSTCSDNKVFGCLNGIYNVDTVNTHGAAVVNDRLTITGNIVDCKNITTNVATAGALTVNPGADVPGAQGMDLQCSHSTITGNVVRSTATGIKLRGNTNPTVLVRVAQSVLAGNVVTIANTDAATTVFGIMVNFATGITLGDNRVEGEAGATFKDGYWLADIDGLSWGNNTSRRAGRSGAKLTTVSNVTLSGGAILDPATNTAGYGIDIAADCSDVVIGGGMLIRDTRGAGATMTHGINVAAGATRITRGHVDITGYTTGQVNGTLSSAFAGGGVASTGFFHGPAGGTPATAARAQGVLEAIPLEVQAGVTIDQLRTEVTVAGEAGSVIRMGVYRDNGAGAPGALLLDGGTVAADTVGVKTITGLAGVAPGGLLWLVRASQLCPTTPPTVRTFSGGMARPVPKNGLTTTYGGFSSGTNVPGALPAAFGVASGSGGAPLMDAHLV